MSAADPNAPLIAGVGELVHRPGDGDAPEPGAMMAAAVREALADSGTGEPLLAAVGLVGCAPPVAWLDGDPGRRVADLLGLEDAATLRSSMQGGNGPQLIVNTVAERIAAGEAEAAVVCGAEALYTVASAMKEGRMPQWPAAEPGREPGEVLEADRPASTDAETAVGMLAPIMAYPLIENAIGAAAGRTEAQQIELAGRLWSGFSRVAATRKHAWSPTAYEPEEVFTASAGNRRVTFPYTKLMNANIQVDQAAALLLCSEAKADALGIDRARRVYLHAGASATDEWFLSERASLAASPAIRACGEALYAHCELEPGGLGPVDLYSCFPAAVQLAAGELGLPLNDPERSLTCTGGLTFFGGPGNNYATHGIAAVARELRAAEPGARGLATALGWYATKHALGVYGNRPPARPFAALAPEPAAAAREVADPLDGEAVAETATVVYDRDGRPGYAILFALLDDGRRILCRSDDAATCDAVAEEGFLGSRVSVAADRSFSGAR